MRTRWFNADTLQIFDGNEVLAEAFFNGGEWIVFAYRSGDVDHQAGQGYIEVDPDLEVKLRAEAQEIAKEPDPSKRAVLDAELKGRRRMFRDDEENRDLVRIRAVQLARRYVRTGTMAGGG